MLLSKSGSTKGVRAGGCHGRNVDACLAHHWSHSYRSPCSNVVVSSSEGIESPGLTEGETPLHLACRGVAGISVYTDSNDHDALQVLEETDEVVDLLLAHGANPSVKDAEGRTPWNNYTALVERFVEYGDLSSEEAVQILENRKDILNK